MESQRGHESGFYAAIDFNVSFVSTLFGNMDFHVGHKRRGDHYKTNWYNRRSKTLISIRRCKSDELISFVEVIFIRPYVQDAFNMQFYRSSFALEEHFDFLTQKQYRRLCISVSWSKSQCKRKHEIPHVSIYHQC